MGFLSLKPRAHSKASFVNLERRSLTFFSSSKSAVSNCVSKCLIQVSNLVVPLPLKEGTVAINVMAIFCSFADWSSVDETVRVVAWVGNGVNCA